jgi:hypothetical protein
VRNFVKAIIAPGSGKVKDQASALFARLTKAHPPCPGFLYEKLFKAQMLNGELVFAAINPDQRLNHPGC